ncbi:MAG TPA: hypothetical protein VHM27_12165 [Rhizomicrobium sp.]|nr:hypothetical protein [Rhizomicrobium sp.]
MITNSTTTPAANVPKTPTPAVTPAAAPAVKTEEPKVEPTVKK